MGVNFAHAPRVAPATNAARCGSKTDTLVPLAAPHSRTSWLRPTRPSASRFVHGTSNVKAE